jgi:hypothetical protein
MQSNGNYHQSHTILFVHYFFILSDFPDGTSSEVIA